MSSADVHEHFNAARNKTVHKFFQYWDRHLGAGIKSGILPPAMAIK